MKKIFHFNHAHLVGIKGVAMTSLAQILTDAEISVTGSDVPENYVTKQQLDRLAVDVQSSFHEPLPPLTDVVIYTAAHQGENNPQVQAAQKQGIPCYSQAEAISFFANAKEVIAVCGVGGKSTVSAMITWILEWNQRHPSFSVGVGNIPGLEKTGAWRASGHHFVVEADEYVTNPTAVLAGEFGTPRFSYLKPNCIVATNITFDHPDVYADFEHTKSTFAGFFSKLPQNGHLIATEQILQLGLPLPNCAVVSVSDRANATYRYEYLPQKSKAGTSVSRLIISNSTFTVTLGLPGEYNMQNAVCAIAATSTVGVSVPDAIAALSTFRSTQRRFELRKTRLNSIFYDDYAHHPSEIEAVIKALKEWYPEKNVVVAFQPHTFSRTRALLQQFAESLQLADRVLILDIFASAREAYDPSITAATLADSVRTINPHIPTTVIPDTHALSQYFLHKLPVNAVVLTAGAGNIYQVYDELQ